MKGSHAAPPAFLFFGVFSGYKALLSRVRDQIVARYGPLHLRGESAIFPFPETRTYGRTMGQNLLRQFFVLATPWPQDGLAPVKREAILLEERIQSKGTFPVERPVNIDPGLINDCRIVLASTKDYAHRIYRCDGIWEEVTLYFEGGEYRPLPWTYPDFRSKEYHAFFAPLRQELLDLTRSGRATTPPPSAPPLP